MKRTIFWHDREKKGAEHCALSAEPGAYRLDGKVVTANDGAPLLIEYMVRADVNWHTRRVEVRVNGGGGKDTLILLADSYGGWWHDARPLPHLAGCIDVDLGFSPSTNTLPIRRLRLQPGAKEQEVVAAWIKAPELTVERLVQSYERLDSLRYRYRAGSFSAEILVNDEGLVVDYANWMAMASG